MIYFTNSVIFISLKCCTNILNTAPFYSIHIFFVYWFYGALTGGFTTSEYLAVQINTINFSVLFIKDTHSHLLQLDTH